MKILCSDRFYIHNEYAHSLIEYFILEGANLYEHFCVFNTHSLLHLAEDSKKYGPLDLFSAFPFESYMQYLKKLPTKYNQHLS